MRCGDHAASAGTGLFLLDQFCSVLFIQLPPSRLLSLPFYTLPTEQLKVV